MAGLKEMARLDAARAPPEWLHKLLEINFFEPCPEHPASHGRSSKRTAGCNFFCTDCASDALCFSCLVNHEGHEFIQIRRSSGNSVVKVADVQHLLSVKFVQTYLINNNKAVFLDKRPMSGRGKSGATRCEECERGLQDEACRFCSLGCKADGIKNELDFSVTFAVSRSGDEYESNEDEASSIPSQF